MPAKEIDLEKQVRSLVAEIIELPEDKIKPDDRFVEDLGMDSMMALEILASIEKRFKVQIPEDYLAKITNLKDTVELIKERLK